MITALRWIVLLTITTASLAGQSSKATLTITPNGAPRDSHRHTVVVHALVSPKAPPVVRLCLVDKEKAVLATLGTMSENDSLLDVAVSQSKYTLRMDLPVDKVGTYRFSVCAPPRSAQVPVTSEIETFVVMNKTEVNSDNDLSASNAGRVNAVFVEVTQPGIRNLFLYRANSAKGPWMRVQLTGRDNDYDTHPLLTVFDPDPHAVDQDRYYRVELFDHSGALRKRYHPVHVPMYGEEDRTLSLIGRPFRSQVAPSR